MKGYWYPYSYHYINETIAFPIDRDPVPFKQDFTSLENTPQMWFLKSVPKAPYVNLIYITGMEAY